MFNVGLLCEKFRMCEQRFLTLINLLFISLTRVKETNQRKRAWGRTPMSPRLRVLHAKNADAFFAKHTRFEQSADFAFAASKRTAKTTGCSTERTSDPVGTGVIRLRMRSTCPLPCETIFLLSNGVGAPWIRCSRSGTAAEAGNLA